MSPADPGTTRLDVALVERGLATSRNRAAAAVAQGHVSIDPDPDRGRALPRRLKASTPVTAADRLHVSGADELVGRAGHKLEGALAAFAGLRVAGRRCLDAGASTGGFTQVLLRAGARQVVAADVGHDQLAEAVRRDPRVVVREGLNLRHATPADIGGPVDVVVADLSFISLTRVMGALAAMTRPDGDLALMVKPQFEVGREAVGAHGVVTSPALRGQAVESVAAAAEAAGLITRDVVRSPLPGASGNVEFFLWLTPGAGDDTPDRPAPLRGAGLAERIARAVSADPADRPAD